MRNYTSADAQQDYNFGIHSLIPKCCVDNYIMLQFDGVEYPGTHMMRLFPQLKGNLKLQYVPCHNCASMIVTGSMEPMEIHHCDDSLGSECYIIRRAYHAQVEKWKVANA